MGGDDAPSGTTMRAAVRYRYGGPDAIELAEVTVPQPAEHEVLVRVRASSANPVDLHDLTGLPYLARLAGGWRRPKHFRLGTDFAGTVEAVGAGASRFRPGDEVFGASLGCGAFAEYVCVGEARGIAARPADLSVEQAAVSGVAGLTALQGLRDKGKLRAGQRVLINGASGGVGTFAVQIAKAFGAEVTAVCSSSKMELVTALGADHVVDYTTTDFTASGGPYDLMLDVAGGRSFAECRRVLSESATVVIVGGPDRSKLAGPLSHMVRMMVAALPRSQRAVAFISTGPPDDLALLAEMIAAKTVRPVIESAYPMDQLAEAMAYLAQGHVRGKLLVSVP
jgi:NADPH:quinone reductase-like Zn-dependent oxidoreductase